MSTVKSSSADLTLNADGSGNDIKFQSNAVEVGSLTAEGVLTVTSSEPKIHLADTDASASGYAKIRGGASGAVFLEADPTDAEVSSHITFKVDNTQMGRFTTDGLCFNSDSAAANALDDYEEGTWTPALSGMTTAGNTAYASQVGFYEKIGRTVHIRGGVEVSSKGTIDGLVLVTGLPFTANGTTHRSCIHLGYADHFSITASESISGTVMQGDTTFLLRVWGDTGGTVNMDDARLSDSSDFYFSGTYYV